ncbi:hypothetical protein MKleb_5564 (plasmid) [Klebsiella sp. PL-2018]|nr:hypothetical protein MKleb_5564 [Klebsiella sp. PL-2018]
MFYQFVDFKAKVFSYIDRVVFWKLAHWLARKYRTGIASLMRWWCKSPKPGQSKTWVLFGKTNHGKLSGEILYRLVGQGKKLFRWRLPEGNPYLRDGDQKHGIHRALQNAGKPAEEIITIRQSKYLNNLIEQDHRNIKRRIRQMLGFKSFRRAQTPLAGIELLHMIREGEYQHPAGDGMSPAEQFYLLVA